MDYQARRENWWEYDEAPPPQDPPIKGTESIPQTAWDAPLTPLTQGSLYDYPSLGATSVTGIQTVPEGVRSYIMDEMDYSQVNKYATEREFWLDAIGTPNPNILQKAQIEFAKQVEMHPNLGTVIEAVSVGEETARQFMGFLLEEKWMALPWSVESYVHDGIVYPPGVSPPDATPEATRKRWDEKKGFRYTHLFDPRAQQLYNRLLHYGDNPQWDLKDRYGEAIEGTEPFTG